MLHKLQDTVHPGGIFFICVIKIDDGQLIIMVSAGGLIVGGCIFNYLNEKNDNIYPSWFVHMFANFAINTVGFILFGIL